MANSPVRVSIVTPSFQQAAFLEQTIQSVLAQTYPNIEYMVLDAGSTDGSVEIIKKYQEKLAYWQSKKDKGPGDAINQGWRKGTGEIIAYLNSDDLLLENAVETIVIAFQENPDADVIYGDTTVVDENGNFLHHASSENFDLRKVFTTWRDPIYQPSAFLKRKVIEKNGLLDETFQFCFDFEYWLRIEPQVKFLHLPVNLSLARSHQNCKTVAEQDVQARELMRIFNQIHDKPVFLNSGVSEQEALKSLHFRSAEHFLNAGHKWDAFRAHIAYCRLAFGTTEASYKIASYLGRILFRT